MFVGLAIKDNAHPMTMAGTIAPLQAKGARLGMHRGCAWIDIARSEVVAQFLESQETELLFIDSDVYFDPDLVAAMQAADGDLITCTYRKRLPPYAFAAMPLGAQVPHIRRWFEAPRRVVGRKRFVEIESNGLGCTLIRRRVLERLIERHPELVYISDEGKPRYWLFQPFVAPDADGIPRPAGDDRAFFLRARAAGFTVECLIDATIFHDGIEGRFAKVFDGEVSS